MEWYYLNTGFNTGQYNMDLDESLAANFTGVPILRVFGWKPYCISLGYNQNRNDINIEFCAQQGIDIVRRPTGGRAILHAEELTYSVVLNSNGKGVHEIYKEISMALLCGLKILGADVDFSKTQPDFGNLYKTKSSIPCFTSSARYEIEYKGKKLVGSAQRRYDDIVLQHGSIIIGDYHKKLPDFLSAGVDDRIKDIIKKDIEAKTVTLNEIMSKEITYEDAAHSIKSGFEREYNISFKEIKAEALCR
jgi:lipoate-protein ligase A